MSTSRSHSRPSMSHPLLAPLWLVGTDTLGHWKGFPLDIPPTRMPDKCKRRKRNRPSTSFLAAADSSWMVYQLYSCRRRRPPWKTAAQAYQTWSRPAHSERWQWSSPPRRRQTCPLSEVPRGITKASLSRKTCSPSLWRWRWCPLPCSLLWFHNVSKGGREKECLLVWFLLEE